MSTTIFRVPTVYSIWSSLLREALYSLPSDVPYRRCAEMDQELIFYEESGAPLCDHGGGFSEVQISYSSTSFPSGRVSFVDILKFTIYRTALSFKHGNYPHIYSVLKNKWLLNETSHKA